MITCLKRPPRIRAEVLPRSPEHKRAVMCFTEKIPWVTFIQVQVTMLSAMSSSLMCQQYIRNKASLNRHMYQIKVPIDQLTKM